MNVSIVYVVRDLHMTVSGVQAAIALEALVSAAFILIGGKVGDLIGRRRAYALGLVGYAVGAVAMTLSQSPHRARSAERQQRSSLGRCVPGQPQRRAPDRVVYRRAPLGDPDHRHRRGDHLPADRRLVGGRPMIPLAE
jgi:hypothetical protein